jgi:hypothetical protein
MNRDEFNKLFDEHFIDECDEVYDAKKEIVEYAENVVKLFAISDVMQQREQLFDFLRWYSDHRKLDYSDSHILVMIEKYQKSNNCA